MKTYENSFPISELSEFARNYISKDMLFFDIETTGLSAARNHIYCIGCGYRKEDEIRITLFFAENIGDEAAVLDAFYRVLSEFSTIVTFNGTTFDIPFILKRTALYHREYQKHKDTDPFAPSREAFIDHFTGKECPPESAEDALMRAAVLRKFINAGNSPADEAFSSVDLYRDIQHMKRLLELPAYRQKCVEEFLGCAREDRFTGGQLIEIYEEYTVHPAQELLHLLLLHNYEDVRGMFRLIDMLSYRQLIDEDYTIMDIFCEDMCTSAAHPNTERRLSGSADSKDAIQTAPCVADSVVPTTPDLAASAITPASRLSIKLIPKHPFPQSIRKFDSDATLAVGKDAALVSFPIRRGELKHFFPDPKNYYYLPDEDAAVHKSVGEFVDRAHRKKATKKNCYIKKVCDYIEIPVASDDAYLRKDFQNKHTYLEIPADGIPPTDALRPFLAAYFSQFFK